jgi:hypothetical protein
MSLTSRLLLSAAIASALAPAALARQSDPVDGVLACRGIADIETRLACFDAAAATLAAARDGGDIVIVERDDVEAVERDSFGFNLPSLPRFRLPVLAAREREAHEAIAETDGSGSAGAEVADATAPTPAPAGESRTPAARTVAEAPRSESRTAAPESEPAEDEIVIVERTSEGDVETVTMRIDRVETVGYSTLVFHMVNGQVWRQVDSTRIRPPSGRATAEISRAMFDSYLLRVNGSGRAIRVRRER